MNTGSKLTVREIALFGVLGGVMCLTKFTMQMLPNVHLLALFIAAFTLTYRAKALVPLYVYILLDGLLSGFALWWAPYLYVWLPLWAVFMLYARVDMPRKIKAPLYMATCALHGLSFGALYAPAQALFFGLSFHGMVAWVIAGLPFDVIHAVSNCAAAALILPLAALLKRLNNGQTFVV